MDAKEHRAKLNGILEAIAAGRTCEQILAADVTLSYHDIFHAVAEAPTGYWRRAAATSPAGRSPEPCDAAPPIPWHRTD
jgi:hypothetical protein